MPEQAPQAGAALTALLRRTPDSNAPIALECFKLLGTLMRSCTSYQVRAASVSSRSLLDMQCPECELLVAEQGFRDAIMLVACLLCC